MGARSFPAWAKLPEAPNSRPLARQRTHGWSLAMWGRRHLHRVTSEGEAPEAPVSATSRTNGDPGPSVRVSPVPAWAQGA